MIAEADGLAKYNSRKDLANQFERDRLLRDAGYQVIHFTWQELMRTPEVVIGRIRAATAAKTGFQLPRTAILVGRKRPLRRRKGGH